MSFIKLRTKFFIENYQKIYRVISYGDRISYYRTIGAEHLLTTLPEQIRHKFTILEMKVVDNVPPHTDSRITCTINFYIITGNFETKFYFLKNHNVNTWQTPGQSNGVIYSKNDLIFTESFVAQDGDVYMLDVTKPHSVESAEPTDRYALCLQTSFYSFEEVKNFLSLENLI